LSRPARAKAIGTERVGGKAFEIGRPSAGDVCGRSVGGQFLLKPKPLG
jgi:hypothetical protein